MFMPDDADNGHHGPLRVNALMTFLLRTKLALTRNESDERKPSLGSEQQLNTEAHHTQKQLSSHNLALSHKKESTQLSKAQACRHKHRYTNWLLVLTSIITMWVGITNFVSFSILSLVIYLTGSFGIMASDFFKPRQLAQPTQQQAQMMIDSFLTRQAFGYFTATIALQVFGLATIIPAALRCYAYAEGAGNALLDVNGTDFRCVVLGGWLLTHAAVSYSMACASNLIVRILSSNCSVENDVPVFVVVDSQSTSLKHVGESCRARSQSCSWSSHC